jgi:hypothetical protein
VESSVGSWAQHLSTKVPNYSVATHFDTTNLFVPPTNDARLALAFYRDGLSLEHTAYRFLSFFKVFNITMSSGQAQEAWLNAHLSLVSGADAKARLAALNSSEPNIGRYLYGSGRCAVAHAFSTPLVDPDNPEDQLRLANDLALIRELAAIFIQRELGVPRPVVEVR